MAHNISGIITSFKYQGHLPNIVLVGCYHLIALKSSYETSSAEEPIPPYEEFTTKVRETIKGLSLYGKCAYIETAYFGGIGVQISETWEKGKVVDGPLISYDGIENRMEYEDVTIVDCSINQTLKNIGIDCQEGKDEFDTVGLGKYRSIRIIYEEYEEEIRRVKRAVANKFQRVP